MTTIYVPRLIESAEQAEALPDGTIATVEEDPAPYYKFDGRWHWGADGGFAARSPVGMTALVPIEAEEEWTVGQEDPSWAPGTESWARRFQAQEPGRRLFRRSVTPWEEA